MSSYKLDMHVIVPRSGCPNRGEDNRQKTVVHGGVTRDRISSQCYQAAMRKGIREDVSSNERGGFATRSKELPTELLEALVEKGHEEGDAINVVKKVIPFVGFKFAEKKGDKKKDDENGDEPDLYGGKTRKIGYLTNVIHYTREEASELADAIHRNFDEILSKKTLKKLKKSIADDLMGFSQRACDDVGVAIFGRMLTDPNKHMTVTKALEVAHAISVCPTAIEDDYFVTQDDLSEVGGGFLGHQDYTSNVFYHFGSIDLRLLAKNLGGSDRVADIAAMVAKHFVLTYPSAKQTSMASREAPLFVHMCIRRRSETCTSAFLRPIDSDPELDTGLQAETRLMEYISQSRNKFGNGGIAWDGYVSVYDSAWASDGDDGKIPGDFESLDGLLKSLHAHIGTIKGDLEKDAQRV